MQRFRVECNFGSRYFDDFEKAKNYFNKCKNKHLDVEFWAVRYADCPTSGKCLAMQMLIAFSGTYLPKY